MNDEEVLKIAVALERERVEYVLVGGIAMGFQGLVRGTKDLDLFVRPDPDNLERLRRALQSVFHDPEIEGISTEDLMGDYSVVRYGPPEGDYLIDVIARLGEAWTYGMLESQDIVVGGVTVKVATPRTLYRMKRGTMRPQDHADAAALQEKFGLDEE